MENTSYVMNAQKMNQDIRKRKQIHLKDFNYEGSDYVYYITICTADKQMYFSDEHMAKIITQELGFRRKAGEILLYCYCLMPDHLHILLSLNNIYKKNLQNWISAFKRYTTRSAKKGFNIHRLWQKNFYEHVVRKEESLIKIAEYIVNNPVRKGLVQDWREYPYSVLGDAFPL